MSGRPDYDAGDLVVCLRQSSEFGFAIGGVWRVLAVLKGHDGETGASAWGVELQGKPDPAGWLWPADGFRRIDPKPPEFWTGTVDADAGERVPA